jgi:N-acetylglucosamine kinase-like BadF-type ATPase
LSWLVGVDVGASHIESALAQEDADPVNRVRRSGTEIKPGRVVQAAEAIATTVDALVRENHPVVSPDRIVVGAAGTHTDALRTELEKTLSGTFQQSLVHVTTDGAIALKAAFGDRPGIIVSAGSGSIAYAKTPVATIQRFGVLGPKWGSVGSGYAMVPKFGA